MQKITFRPNSLSQLKIILQQQFSKTYGQPIQYKNLLLRTQSIIKILRQYSLDPNNRQDLTIFAQSLYQNLKQSRYEFIFSKQSIFKMIIRRKNVYQQIKNQKTLIKYIQNYHQGLYINDQFLKYTYKGVKNDIDKLIRQNRLKMVYQQGSKEYFYLFPRIYQMQFQIKENVYKYFGMIEYLDVCKQLNPKEGERRVEDKRSNNVKQVNGDLNYKLPGYMELKQKWIKNQIKK